MLSGIKKRDFDNLQLMHLWMPVCMNYIHVLEIQLVCKWVIKKGINLDNTKLYLIPETWCCIGWYIGSNNGSGGSKRRRLLLENWFLVVTPW